MPTSICPDCHEEVYVEAELEQGDSVTCDECGTQLVVVGLDPIELDPKTDDDADRHDSVDDFDQFGYSDDHY